MRSFLFEAEGEINWGKFLVGVLDDEWRVESKVAGGSLVAGQGWSESHLLVVDLATGEGALFEPSGLALADLRKHQVWVCPLFEPFLGWLYERLSNGDRLDELPPVVDLRTAPASLFGYRRPGVDEDGACVACGSYLGYDDEEVEPFRPVETVVVSAAFL